MDRAPLDLYLPVPGRFPYPGQLVGIRQVELHGAKARALAGRPVSSGYADLPVSGTGRFQHFRQHIHAARPGGRGVELPNRAFKIRLVRGGIRDAVNITDGCRPVDVGARIIGTCGRAETDEVAPFDGNAKIVCRWTGCLSGSQGSGPEILKMVRADIHGPCAERGGCQRILRGLSV